MTLFPIAEFSPEPPLSLQTSKPQYTALEQRLGYSFSDATLLERALTHRSFSSQNNERLEFVGDGLVNAVVAMLLFDAYPELDEGALSRLRSRLVSKDGLAVVAKRFELGALLLLGTGERKSGGRHRDSILADALEAIAGAIVTEAGFGVASAVAALWFADGILDLDPSATRDSKTRLQEWLQGKGFPLPTYAVVSVTGEDHQQYFEVSCQSQAHERTTRGSASSRKKAEQIAAEALLEILTNDE